MPRPQPAILFVCLGNICRSPLAEAAFRQAAERAGVAALADSAGTAAWHAGKPPDPRARAVARRHGAPIDTLRARPLVPGDFHAFTQVLVMDHANLVDAHAICPPDAPVRPGLLLDWLPGREGQAVADPYYGSDDGFEQTWRDVAAAAAALVAHIAGRG